MPFISKDWRSPGEAWVKTQEGWEKKKVLEKCKAIREQASIEETDETDHAVQPHCQITIKCTREIAGFNELDEAVKQLDFRSAVHDVRRFNYICALLELLVGQQMITLSGCAQKALLSMLEEVAAHAIAIQHNPRGLRKLITNLRALSAAERAACWGANMQIHEPNPDTNPKFLQLPEECLREVILRLSDHRDLTSSSQASNQLAVLVDEQRVWRELCRFHFTIEQIDMVVQEGKKIDWKQAYHSLKRSYGLREDRQYAETLSLCRHCRCLFWRSLGHPCIADQCPEFRARLQEAGGLQPPSPVPPSAFLKFFSL
ncbi:hypothetical protein FQR65_LT08743 [Abscondita terminalis]|nr:hypothetical protein FQR65_LT08743 [Abscondita terminalis]